jgi:hypothetical protein
VEHLFLMKIRLDITLKKATLKNIGETAYLKIIMNHFKTDLQKVKQIGESRGTATDTLIESYDLDNK